MIPIIDLQAHDVLDRIDKAYTTVGFAVFVNALNYSEQKDMNTWFKTLKEFFKLPLEIKKQYAYKGGIPIFGYSGLDVLYEQSPGVFDIKELFDYQNLKESKVLWPNLDNFKNNALRSIEIAESHTLRVLKLFDTILDTGTTLFDAHNSLYNPVSFTRIIHYPSYNGILKDNQLRIAEHCDFGTITSIWQVNNVSGLEVQDLNGIWHTVPYAEDSVIVNIGDLLQRWTNDYFVSTKHRVGCSNIHLNKYSMPHFAHPIPGTKICNLRDKEIAKYSPIESKEYLLARLEGKNV